MNNKVISDTPNIDIHSINSLSSNRIQSILSSITINQYATDAIIDNLKSISGSSTITATAIAKSSGVKYDPQTKLTTFSFFIPTRSGSQQKIRIWIPINDNHGVIRYIKKEFNMNQKNGVNYIALNNIIPAQENNSGYLYQIVDKTTGNDIAVPDGEYFPAGPEGKVAAVIDYKSFKWDDYKHFISDQKHPLHITKIHVGIETKKGTLSALTSALKTGEKRLLHTDVIELFPMNEYSGEHNNTAEFNDDGTMTIIPRKSKAGMGWGYDTNGNLKSLYSNYGTPHDLMEFVNTAHSLGKKVSIDLQLNHLGEEGSTINEFFDFSNPVKTAWGDSINNRDEFVKEWILESIKQFIENYHFDMVRLDMTPHYYNDEFLQEIGRLVPEYSFGLDNDGLVVKRNLFSIAEDDRYDNVVNSQYTSIDLAWDFALTHLAEDIISDHSETKLWNLVHMLMGRDHAVVYHISHDEQGNNYAKQLRSPQMLMLMALSKGVPMEFNYNFFHFFTGINQTDVVIRVFAEKSGVYNHFTEDDWKYLTEFHDQFSNFAELKEFMLTFQKDYFLAENAQDKLKDLLSNKELQDKYYNIGKKHFRQMEIMAQSREYDKNDSYENLLTDMRLIRSRYPWLSFTCSPKDEQYVDNGVASILRVNPFNAQEQLKVIANWDDYEKNIEVPLKDGKWRIYSDSHHNLQGAVKEISSTVKLSLKPHQAIIMERLVENPININWNHAINLFKQIDDVQINSPSDQLLITENLFEANKEIAGKVTTNNSTYYYGFASNRLYIFNDTNVEQVTEIYTKDHNQNVKRIEISDQNLIRESSSQIYIDLETLDINGQNTSTIYIPLSDGNVAQIYVPG